MGRWVPGPVSSAEDAGHGGELPAPVVRGSEPAVETGLVGGGPARRAWGGGLPVTGEEQ